MNSFIIANIIFYLSLSIALFDLDYKRAKSLGEPELPNWVGIIYIVLIASWIYILFTDWKFAILGVVVYYLSAIFPLPQIVGNFLMGPFKPKNNE
ncbi:MAG: hypothetical protein PHO28_02010 [Candidatus Pacebacteria bacterium]|nr:hypothetical protein [Candidatus Paceibacterota bacterium]